jgi:glucosamine--fructose-6-phosphate aminotransferase (isomerizing)
MAAEIAEAPGVFARAVRQAVPALDRPGAVYTVARGSSDAAALILAYEMMRETGVPVTSLPPSVFSLGAGVDLSGALALVVSQSGASEDLVRSARGARGRGARVVAVTNVEGSGVEQAADLTLRIGAGVERAVPATKTVVGAVGAGMALIGALAPGYAARAAADADLLAGLGGVRHPRQRDLAAALLRSNHVYVIGRDTGYGAAQELALKIKETCAIHAEAYSSSEVLHGPMQLATRQLTILMVDTGAAAVQDSLNTAEARLNAAGGRVHRVGPADLGVGGLTPAGGAALMLAALYPVVHEVALALGHDPDAPAVLSKVTQTT